MYSHRTEFLTRKGWKHCSAMTSLDDIANYGQRGRVEWVPVKLADLKISQEDYSLSECQVGKSGKFCVTKDHPIRFFHYSKGEEVSFQHTLDDILQKLESIDYLPGHIPTTFSTSHDTRTPEGNTAVLLSRMFNRIHKVDEEGNIFFAISRSLSKQQIVDFLLKSGIRASDISMEENNTKVVLKTWKLKDLYEAIIATPYVLSKVVSSMLQQVNSKNTCTRTLRFYCSNLASLAQIATSFGGRNSKILYSPIKKGANHALVVEPKDGSVSFRNRVIVFPERDIAVSTSVQHPITRYDGRIASL